MDQNSPSSTTMPSTPVEERAEDLVDVRAGDANEPEHAEEREEDAQRVTEVHQVDLRAPRARARSASS